MAVAVQVDFKGATLEQYDQALKNMGFKAQGAGTPGLLFHWIMKTPEGWRAVDVWRTREDFEKFVHEKIGPFMRDVGHAGAPEVQFFEVHNYLTAG